MARMFNSSIATIDEPQFINETKISPLISQCEVKVLYVGENRNGSFISKKVATKMGETLPGSPIVGYFREDRDDFFDHGSVITIDGDGVKFEDKTRPYGFVAPDAKIWFQKFIDTDAKGNQVEREYLMTTAYLWTGQYPECAEALKNENPQSMKLNDDSLEGTWTKKANQDYEIFIINDAIIQNLCILGQDVEPCFEGADVSAPKVSKNFSFKNTNTLFSMMKELKELLVQEGGKYSMENENIQTEEPVVENTSETPVEENFSEVSDNSNENISVENEINTEEFKKEDEKEEPKKDDEETSENNGENDEPKEEEQEENEDDKKKYELLESEYSLLKEQYSTLQTSYNELLAFKNNIEDKQKDELIASFYMLDEEDKKNVIANKSNYSLDDIEKELSVICVRKKVNFNLDKEEEKVEEAPTTFAFNDADETVPAWLKVVDDVAKMH